MHVALLVVSGQHVSASHHYVECRSIERRLSKLSLSQPWQHLWLHFTMFFYVLVLKLLLISMMHRRIGRAAQKTLQRPTVPGK